MLPKSFKLFLLLFAFVTAGRAEERVVTFDPPTYYPESFGYYHAPEVEDHFIRITPNEGSLIIPTEETQRSPTWPWNGTYYARFYRVPDQAPWEITHEQGLSFDFLSIDVSEYSLTVPHAFTVQFVGHKTGGGTVEHTVTTDGIFDGHGPEPDFETFEMPSGFTDLTKVVVSAYGHYDNIRVNVHGQETLPPRPQPLPRPALPLLHEVDWEDFSDRIGSASPTGGGYLPSETTGTPFVRDSIGAMQGPALELRCGGDGGEASMWESMGFSLRERAKSYKIEFDIVIESLGSNRSQDYFSILSIRFTTDGTIFYPGVGSIGSFEFGNVFHFELIFNSDLQFEVRKDGILIYEGTLGSLLPFDRKTNDFVNVGMVLADSSEGNALVGIDNIKVFGYDLAHHVEPIGPKLTDAGLKIFGKTDDTGQQIGLPIGETQTAAISLWNDGDECLNISAIHSDSSDFTLSPQFPISLTPRSPLITVPITFTPTQPGWDEENLLYVVSDSPDSPHIISRRWNAVVPDTMAIDEKSFSLVMPRNASETIEFELTNFDTTTRDWSLEYVGSDGPAPSIGDPVVPDDPEYGRLWAHREPTGAIGGMDSTHAWSMTTGDPEIVVGVIDTGVDINHPDLINNIWHNLGETPNNGIDDDGNGFIDDVTGWDFYDEDNDVSDTDGHGTHVAGIIAAAGNNATGVTGVAWNALIMPLKHQNDMGVGFTSDAVEALDYATDAGVRITNNSWGHGNSNLSLQSAIQRARDAGSLFVAGAGNDSEDNDSFHHYPSGYDIENIISVAATEFNDTLAFFSNYGESTVDLGAPGVDIYSTEPGGIYGYREGTSMSTPHVSGTAALLLALDQNATYSDLINRLKTSVDPIASLSGKVASGGRLNAARALAQAGTMWLAPEEEQGTLIAGSKETIRLDLNSSELPEGRFSQTVKLISEDLVIDIPVTLTIIGDANGLPVIYEQPETHASAKPGDTVTLKVSASGVDLTYQWFEGLVGDTTRPIGGNSDALEINDIDQIGDRPFWVSVTNGNGSTNSDTSVLSVVTGLPLTPFRVYASDGEFADKVRITWEPAPGAASYFVHRATYHNPYLSTQIATGITTTFFDDMTAEAGTRYYYWVSATGPGGTSGFGGPNSGRKKLPSPNAPSSLAATDGTRSELVSLFWDSVPEAWSYHIFRSETPDFGSSEEIAETQGIDWVDQTAVLGQSYYYWVQAASIDEESASTGPAGGRVGVPVVDLSVGRSLVGQQGISVYNTTGEDQTIGLKSRKLRPAKWQSILTNRGTLIKEFSVWGPRSSRKFRYTYLEKTSPAINVTAAVFSGTHLSPELGLDEIVSYECRIKAHSRARRSRRKIFRTTTWLLAQTTGYPLSEDKVVVRTLFKR